MTPTEAGQAYFDRLRPLLEEFDNLQASVRDASHATRAQAAGLEAIKDNDGTVLRDPWGTAITLRSEEN